MKILKVSFQNLNSLRGEHTVDLENGPLARAGIFAITGPTGAGKSTILDAITLALYGRAARYGAKGPEDMMSRHTGKCRAEVEFAVKDRRFRASWHLKKAHGKVHGKIQDAQRRVFDAEGVTLAQNKTQADAEIEKLTGLNYERFLRSVLLAQGEFARFLKADADERADLLEQLTGTEIYTRLGRRAHEERARLEAGLTAEQNARAAVVLLGETERVERAAEIARYSEELAAGTLAHEAAAGRLVLGRQLRTRREELRLLGAREAAFAARSTAARAGFEHLERHRLAEPFCADLARLDATAARAGREQKAWHEAQAAARAAVRALASARIAARTLAGAEAAARERELTRQRAEETAAAARLVAVQRWLEQHTGERALETALPAIGAQLALLTEARRQQGERRRQGEKLAAGEDALRARRTEAQARRGEVSAELTRRKAANEKLAEELSALLGGRQLGHLQNDLKQRHARAALLTRLSVLLQQCVDAAGREKTLAEKEASLADELPRHREQAERARNDLAQASKLVEAWRENLTQAQIIASFEEHRARLAPEQPCPLCGSAHHPFAGPSANAATDLAALAARLARGKQDQKVAERRYREQEQILTRVTEQHRTTAERRVALRQEHAAARQSFAAGAGEHGIALAAPADLQVELGEMAESIARTEQRIEATQFRKNAHDNAVRVYDDLRVQAGRLEEASDAAASALVQAGEARAAHALESAREEEKLAALVRKIRGLLEPFAEAVPDPGKEAAPRRALESRRDQYARQAAAAAELASALQQLRHGVREAEGEWQRARQQVEEFSHPEPTEEHDVALAAQFAREWKTTGTARERVRDAISEQAAGAATETMRGANYRTTRGLVDAETAALRGRLAETAGLFADLADPRAARLPDEAAAHLEGNRRALEAEGNALLGERRHLEQDVAGLRERQAPEDDALAELEQTCRQQRAANETVIAQRARVEEEIRRDDESRSEQGTRAAAIERAQEQLRYWRWLHDLIGSHDGGKFRRFAQGLTLDLLVRHANRHLARLSERYRLHRAEDEELSLNVLDHYQAGSLRPITSLSGGESFLTSLALALGLSDLAGRNVRIDSLFVDEGFGSLDADTLDIAVAALDTLRTNDKMIGIISHVELLKERISTQIRVEKLAGGVSSITVVG